MTRRLIAEFRRPGQAPTSPSELEQLTDREREMMALVGAGLSNEEIAGQPFVSPATIKTHVSRAIVKLGDRARLVVFAHEAGPPGWT